MTDTLRDRLGACAHKQLKKQLVGEQVWYACECGQKFHVAPWDGRVSVAAAQPAPAVMGEDALPIRGVALLTKLADGWVRTGQLGESLRTDEYVAKHREAIMGIYEYCGKTLNDYLRYECERTAAAESREDAQ